MSDSKARMPPLTLDFDCNERIRLREPIWWTLVTVIWDIEKEKPPWRIRLLIPYQTSFKAEWMEEFIRIHNEEAEIANREKSSAGLMQCTRNRKFNQWILQQYHAPPSKNQVRMSQRILMYKPGTTEELLTDVPPAKQNSDTTKIQPEATKTSQSLKKAARQISENKSKISPLECASSKTQKPPKFHTIKTTFNMAFYPTHKIQFR